MKIVALVGSIRKESVNMQIAKTIQERYEEQTEIEIADISSLPYYDQDQELNPPQAVQDFKSAIAQADGVIIITPEYNWSVPGVLKNALDWASRVEREFIGKPVMILGASPGAVGTVRAQLHLRDILSSPGLQAKVLPPGSNEILINFVNDKLDTEKGRLKDEATLNFIDGKINNFFNFVKSC